MKLCEAMRSLGAIVALCGVSVVVSGCGGKSGARATFDGEQAMELAREQLDFGARHPGTPGHTLVGEWIADQLVSRGWKAEFQGFSYRGQDLRNVVGRPDQERANLVLLGAHYDTRPVADREPDAAGEPVPGANDGASGVAVLLELARVLAGQDLPCEVWLVFFDAEDSGHLSEWDWIVGSQYFADNLSRVPSAVVIVDMVGDADLQLFMERNSDPGLSREIWEVAAALGHEAFVPTLKHGMLDDHTPFLERGLRAIDIIDFDYPYWHTTQDTLDKISSDSLAQVGLTLQEWLSSCR